MPDDRGYRIARTVALKAAVDAASRLSKSLAEFEPAFDYLFAKLCAELEVARAHIPDVHARMLAKLRPWGPLPDRLLCPSGPNDAHA